jgi:hypothetical protein
MHTLVVDLSFLIPHIFFQCWNIMCLFFSSYDQNHYVIVPCGVHFVPFIRSGTTHSPLLIIHHNHVTWPRPFQSITSCNMLCPSTSLLQFNDNGSTCPETCNCCLSKTSLIWIAPSKALYIGWGEGKACTAWVYSTGGTLLKRGSNTTCAKTAYAMWKVYDAQHYE